MEVGSVYKLDHSKLPRNVLLVKGEVMKEEEEEKQEMEVEREGKRGTRKRKKPSKPTKYVKKKKKKIGPVEGAMSIESDKLDEPISRWTDKRYKLAEESILKIMKAKGAVNGNPIFRADLRAEARKLIGDTGLLDHLLRHMAGKIAGGGKERFRRRHNPEGAMEYWLESADLVSIRKEAGVDDPYWIPPEGWKLGDSPMQDPVCARELKKLREDVNNMKREIQELAHKQGCGQANRDMIPACLDDVQEMGKLLLMPLKALQEDLLKRKAKIEEQLLNVSKALIDMEEDLEGLVVEAKSKKRVVEAAPTGAVNEYAGEVSSGGKEEEKAARRHRLKSGFIICKPDGTFLWPDMAAPTVPAQVMNQVEDILAVSSPSSVYFSKQPPQPPAEPPLPPLPPAEPLLPPPAPPAFGVLRPVARRASFGTCVSTVTRGLSGSEAKDKVGVASPTTSTANRVFVPDLNEAPPAG